jgi:Tfp pilus assembly protein PilV
MEVMVALAILATSLVVIFSHQARSIDLANEAKILVRATFLGQAKMAELLTEDRIDRVTDEGDVTGQGVPFRWRTSSEETSVEGLDRIAVSVEWEDGERKESLTLVTYVAATE